MQSELDLLLINPSGRKQIYQELADELASVEPPLWCRLIAGYVRDRGYSVDIVDAEADELDPEAVADIVAARKPALVGMIVFGHQPSASTQQMAAAVRLALRSRIAIRINASSLSAATSLRSRNVHSAKSLSISPATAKARSRFTS